MAPAERFHLGPGSVCGVRVFEIRRGTSVLARLAGWVLRFPRAGSAVPVRVSVRRDAGGLGAFDTLYYHEYRCQLPARLPGVQPELKLHAVRRSGSTCCRSTMAP